MTLFQMTMDQIIHTLDMAAGALRRLPGPRRQPLTLWVPYAREAAEAYGWGGDPMKLYRGPVVRQMGASKEEIDALDTVFGVFWPLLSQEQMQLLLGRHMGMSWRRLARERQKRAQKPASHTACRRLYEDILIDLRASLA